MNAGRAQSLEGIERQIGRLFRRARRVIGQRAQAVHPDLHPAAYLMLGLLVECGPLRPSDVVDYFDIDKGAVSRQVQQLVDLGLVVKTRDPQDGRAFQLEPTEEARSRMSSVTADRRVHLDERLAGWTDDELTGLVASLERYNAALD